MTLGPLAFASLFLVPFVLGAALLRRLGIGARGDRLGFGAWSLLAGGLGSGAVLFAWCLFELPLDARWIAPTLLLLAGLLAWRTPRPQPFGAPPPRAGAGRSEELVFLLVVALLGWSVVAASLRASTRSIILDDEASLWAMKALLLFDCGGLSEAYGVRTAAYPESHPDYPLLNPLLQLWAFVHARAPLAVENRLPIQVFVLGLVLALASALRTLVRPGLAAVLLLLAQANGLVMQMTRTAGADQMVAFGLLVALDGLLRAARSGDERGYRLAALGMAFAVASKNEGAPFVAALLVALALATAWPGRRACGPPKRVWLWFLLAFAPLAASVYVRQRYGFTNDLVHGNTFANLRAQLGERLVPLTRLLGGLLFTRLGDHHGLFAAFLVLCALAPRRLLRPRLRTATLFLLFLHAGWFLIYVATPHDLEWHVMSSARRLVYTALPACLLWLALVLAEDPWLGRHLRARRPYLVSESDSTGATRTS